MSRALAAEGDPEGPAPEPAWVLAGEPRPVRRALRLVRRADPARVLPLGPDGVCAEVRDPPARLRLRVERRLGHAVEARLSCDLGWYPLGRGYVVLLVGAPADGLEPALDAMRPSYREVARPATPDLPIRVCLPEAAVPDPLALAGALREQGFDLRGVYAVGGCHR